MARSERSLAVYISGVRCGSLREDRNGALSFAYDIGYEGVPLSLSMPVGLARYGDRIVRPYLQGLLPDEERVRSALGSLFGVSGENPFRLLSHIGLDCPGAVQICEDDVLLPEEREGDVLPLSDSDIASMLRSVKRDAASAWDYSGGLASDELQGHWSLGGCHAKFALRSNPQGGWMSCSGAAATTHIFKPGVLGLDGQALVEFISMRTAEELGLPAAHVCFRHFEDEPAIIVERYDRIRMPDGKVVRRHQEDVCQALGVSPLCKYADQGGPATPDIFSLLVETGLNAANNSYRFALYLFFNYLLGATDAHAKNHSLLIDDGGVALAPLYDVASIAPYSSLRPRKRKPLRAALSIGEKTASAVWARSRLRKWRAIAVSDLLA